MSSEMAFFVLGLLYVASLIAAYNMGWQNGHDIHHSDDREPGEGPAPTDKGLWV